MICDIVNVQHTVRLIFVPGSLREGLTTDFTDILRKSNVFQVGAAVKCNITDFCHTVRHGNVGKL